MPLTVTQALQMKIFNKCRLLTGQAGLQNEILWVNILEILDDLSHIEPGEFLITTAHGFNAQSESRQQEMIELFAARNLAAMAIQTGHYLQLIPASFIHFAEEHNIPLIEIPPDVSFKSLTRALMNELIQRDQSSPGGQGQSKRNGIMQINLAVMKKLWQQLIETENPEELYLDLERHRINPRDSILVLAMALGHAETAGSEQAGEIKPDLPGQAENAIAIFFQQHGLPFLLGPSEGCLTLLFQSKQLNNQHQASELIIPRKLHDQLQGLDPSRTIRTGCSSIHSSIGDLKKALHEAENALYAARLGFLDYTKPVFYRTMGLYRMIMDLNNVDTLRGILNDTAAPLLEYDLRKKGALMQTLSVYLQSCSIKKAAETLFIHRHTMRYRLGQIEKLTGLNPLLPADALQLNLGLHIYNYLNASNLLK